MKKLLILDLDETLVHATVEPLNYACDFLFSKYHIYKRPHLSVFLDFCKEHYEVAIWTASSEVYADAVTKELFSENYPLKFVWSVKRCVQKEDPITNGYLYIKDLRKARKFGYDVEDILMVDDTAQKVKRQPRSHMHVEPFEGRRDDEGLLKLIEKLKKKAC